mgnify:CR=1 FL=1
MLVLLTLALDGVATSFSGNTLSFANFGTSYSSYLSTLELTVASDLALEGDETAIFTLNVGGGLDTGVIIRDTSVPPAPNMQIANFSMNEGATVSQSFTSNNLPSSTLYWKAVTNTDELNPNSGTVSVTGGSISLTSVEDQTTDGDTEVIVRFFGSSSDRSSDSNPIQDVRVTVLDTSRGGNTISIPTATSVYGIEIYNASGKKLITPNLSVLNYAGDMSASIELDAGESHTITVQGVTTTNADEIGILLSDSSTTPGSNVDKQLKVERGTNQFIITNESSNNDIIFQYQVVRY